MDTYTEIQHLEVAEAFVNKFVAMTFGNYQGIGTGTTNLVVLNGILFPKLF